MFTQLSIFFNSHCLRCVASQPIRSKSASSFSIVPSNRYLRVKFFLGSGFARSPPPHTHLPSKTVGFVNAPTFFIISNPGHGVGRQTDALQWGEYWFVVGESLVPGANGEVNFASHGQLVHWNDGIPQMGLWKDSRVCRNQPRLVRSFRKWP